MSRSGALLHGAQRNPFWASAFVVLLTYVLRRRLAEPEIRRQLELDGLAHKVPLAAVLRHHGVAVARIVLASVCIAPAGLVYIFGLAYGTEEIGLSKSGLLSLVTFASLIMIVSQPLFGLLSDRIGRKPVFVTGVAGSAVTVPLWLNALNNGSWPQIYVFGLVLMGVFVAMSSGVLLATFLEMFPADIRFSGMAVSFTTGIVITGFIPAICQSMVGGSPDDWPSVAWLFAGLMTVSHRRRPGDLPYPHGEAGPAPIRETGRSGQVRVAERGFANVRSAGSTGSSTARLVTTCVPFPLNGNLISGRHGRLRAPAATVRYGGTAPTGSARLGSRS